MEQQNLSPSHPDKSILAAFGNTIVALLRVHSAAPRAAPFGPVLRLALLSDCQHIVMHGYYTLMMFRHKVQLCAQLLHIDCDNGAK